MDFYLTFISCSRTVHPFAAGQWRYSAHVSSNKRHSSQTFHCRNVQALEQSDTSRGFDEFYDFPPPRISPLFRHYAYRFSKRLFRFADKKTIIPLYFGLPGYNNTFVRNRWKEFRVRISSCLLCCANATVAPNDKKVKTPTYRAPPDLPDFLILIISIIYEPIFIKLSILFTLALFSSSSKFSVEIIDRAIRHRDISRSTIVPPNNDNSIHWILFFIVRAKRKVCSSCCGCIQPVRNLKPSHDNLFFRTRRNPRLGLWTRGAQERPNQRCNVTLLNPVWNVSHQYSLLSRELPDAGTTATRQDLWCLKGCALSRGKAGTQCESFTFINTENTQIRWTYSKFVPYFSN